MSSDRCIITEFQEKRDFCHDMEEAFEDVVGMLENKIDY